MEGGCESYFKIAPFRIFRIPPIPLSGQRAREHLLGVVWHRIGGWYCLFRHLATHLVHR
jgi:hypothetical protein